MDSGLLVYGYMKKDAELIQSTLSSLLERPLFLHSASARESKTIETLLEASDTQEFTEDKTNIVLFVNITDEEITKIINFFPDTVKRPIFCGLTEHNITWPFSELKEHLLEEQAYWQKQKNEGNS